MFIQEDALYLFFETKNSVTLQGDIGVAVSKDEGATWKHLGIALDEEWHLSYPFVFSYQNQVNMHCLIVLSLFHFSHRTVQLEFPSSLDIDDPPLYCLLYFTDIYDA